MKVNINGVEYVPSPKLRDPGGSLGLILYQARRSCRMTLDEAAKDARISRSYLWELEQSDGMPSLAVAARLARTYGLPLGVLGACVLKSVTATVNRGENP